ncbi:hypothetical protein jhhlp_002796 [Lomentospora prolificans]|uniref:Ribosomal protein bL31m N-terminal domain-containing protein n=1 Tax=Lomentospora prolificans TaxID=41688 RepID=A0A2N3NEX6_9PEZI|nr:hypothetical protein jhhlp_002796 [Lomentospora prolificans]
MRPRLPRGNNPLTFAPTQPTTTLRPQPTTRLFSSTPSASARLIRRPRRPYTFTQLIQLSDGSTFTARTTSPQALYRSTKDTRNHVLWQPSEKTLRNVELDEAGKLAAFRERYGRGFDLRAKAEEEEDVAAADAKKGGSKKEREAAAAAKLAQQEAAEEEYDVDDLGDLIGVYGAELKPEVEKVKTWPAKKK